MAPTTAPISKSTISGNLARGGDNSLGTFTYEASTIIKFNHASTSANDIGPSRLDAHPVKRDVSAART